jgi:hypothetical protein
MIFDLRRHCVVAVKGVYHFPHERGVPWTALLALAADLVSRHVALSTCRKTAWRAPD